MALSKVDFVATLPPEIGYLLFSFLDASALGVASRVSTVWRSFADDNHVWADLWRRDFADEKYAVISPADRKTVWQLAQGWKFAYKYTLRDTDPTHFTMRTLCDTRWEFYFKYANFRQGKFHPRFLEDFSFVDPWLQPMNWRFVDEHGNEEQKPWTTMLQYTLTHCLAEFPMHVLLCSHPMQHQRDLTRVQVQEFPFLRVTRGRAWIMENAAVRFTSLDARQAAQLAAEEAQLREYEYQEDMDEDEDEEDDEELDQEYQEVEMIE